MNYYQILGVSLNATEKEIQKAFRILARKNHPDVNPNDPQAEARFKKINEAYQTLKNPTKRIQYNKTIHSNWSQTTKPSNQSYASQQPYWPGRDSWTTPPPRPSKPKTKQWTRHPFWDRWTQFDGWGNKKSRYRSRKNKPKSQTLDWEKWWQNHQQMAVTQPPITTPSEQALTEFVIYQLSRHVGYNDIILTICQVAQKNWSEAELFVQKIELKYQDKIIRRQSILFFFVSLITIFFGFFLSFVPHVSVAPIGWAMLLGGLVGLWQTAKQLKGR